MTQTAAIRAHRCLVHQGPSPSLVSCATPAPLPPQTGKGMGEGARRGIPGLAEATRHLPICHCLHTCLSVVTQQTPCSLAASVMHAYKTASPEVPSMGSLSLSLCLQNSITQNAQRRQPWLQHCMIASSASWGLASTASHDPIRVLASSASRALRFLCCMNGSLSSCCSFCWIPANCAFGTTRKPPDGESGDKSCLHCDFNNPCRSHS